MKIGSAGPESRLNDGTDGSAEGAGRTGWRATALFFAANALFGAGLYAHAFLYNFYLDALGRSEAVMGAAAASLTAGGLLALLPAGALLDRAGPRVAYLTACAVTGAGLAAGAVAVEPMTIYAAALLAGAGTAAWRVSMGPILMRLTSARIRARAFSWNVALLVASGAIWTAAAGAIPARVEAMSGVRGAGASRIALLAGVSGTVLAAMVFLLVGRGAGAAGVPFDAGEHAGGAEAIGRGRMRDIAAGLRIPAPIAGLVALVAFWMVASALVIPFFNLYFLRRHGLSVATIGVIFAAAQGFAAVGIIASGEAAARFGARRTLIAWMLSYGPVLWAIATVHGAGAGVALYMVQNLVPPATNPLVDQILLEQVPEEKQGAVSSWRNAATEGSGLIGASAGGLLLQRLSFTALFVTAGVIGLGGAAALGRRLGWSPRPDPSTRRAH